MIKVSVIGYGNVGQHLADAFEKSPHTELVQVYSRRVPKTDELQSKFICDLGELATADIYILAVSDSVINEISSRFPFTDRLVAHTSGAVSMHELSGKNRRGVFYPLQTFSKSKPVDFTQVPICIEAETEHDFNTLEQTAKAISQLTFAIDSAERKSLHVAAVFVSNFTNHLYAIGEQICVQHQVPFEILKPLIKETADKVQTLSPTEAQTGPAIRNDSATIATHLQMLTNENQRDIYKILTDSIQNNGQKL